MHNQRYSTVIFILIIIFLTIPIVSYARPFKVIKVYDGETIKVVNDKELDIRLLGLAKLTTSVERLNLDQTFGYQVKKRLASMILNKTVEIKIYGLDRLGHMLGVVYLDGKNINLEMVKFGLAEVQKEKILKKFDLVPYKKAESEARSAGRGMWALGGKAIASNNSEKVKVQNKSILKISHPTQIHKVSTASKTNVRKIEFDIGNKSEKVKIYFESFTFPDVFDINGGNPRVVIDIHNVSVWNGKDRIPVNGKIIKQIRTYLHKKAKKQRIVLDLDIESTKNYSVTQFHDISKNLYVIEIQPAKISF